MTNQFIEALLKAVHEELKSNYDMVTNAPYGAMITDASGVQTNYYRVVDGGWQQLGEIEDVQMFKHDVAARGVVFTTKTVSSANPNSARNYQELVSNGGFMRVSLPLSENDSDIPKVIMGVLSGNAPSPKPSQEAPTV